ncbi:uncharacterized protein LOC134816852 [Bolinopsis microptera]|uniref:uncharacterized protein LOC134816852 n=1 Tax=Bolinopsis microptera TaxID=2820187 RepID=UPI0030797ACE
MGDDPTLTRSQELIKEFNYDQQEDVEGCVARWSDQLEKDLHMDYREIDYESREKIKTKDKQTLSRWIVVAVDLVRRQSSQMYLLKEIIECFKTEALADKEKVIRLQGQLLMQKDEQLQLLKTSVEETVQTTVESGIQNYSAAVQQNSASGTVCNSKILKKVMKSVAAEDDRSKNLIVFGLKEEEEEQLPALVTAILMKTGRLRETHKDVWICPDRSSEERATRKHLVTDLKKKRAEQTHLDHYIRYGKYRLDLLGITETHMPGSGTTLLDNGSLLIHSGRVDGIKRQGVGLSLSKRIRNSLISFTPTSEWVLTARLHSKQISISVVVAYAPTEGAEESEKDKFYRTLTDTFDGLPRHDIKLLLGDFNAKVTSGKYGSEAVIGGESLHSSSNDNGTRLVDFCATNQLVIGGTLFEHKNIHKGTWRSPNGLTVNQIDHICIGKRFRQSLFDVRVCRGADIGSDHYLVLGLLKIKLQSVTKINANRPNVPAIERLRDSNTVTEYNVALQNRFASLDSEVDLEDMWRNLSQTVTDVSLEVLGKRPRKAKEQHLSRKTKDLLIQRAQFKRKDPNSDANRSEYSKLNKLVKKSSKLDDNNWAVRVATDLEEAASKGQQREVWAKIKKISGKNKKPQASCVRDKNGRKIADPQQQRDRWKEHFTELLNPPLSSVDLADLDTVPPQPHFNSLSCSDGPPTRDEISYSLTKLKNNKSPGVDGITNEQLKVRVL